MIMKNSIRFSAMVLFMLSLSLVFFSCEDKDDSSDGYNCAVQFEECLTNGARQAYFPYSADGVPNTSSCFLNIQMGFEMDGTFTWNRDDDCDRLVTVENFTGEWTLENNKTEIHITPPFFPRTTTVTVLKVISLGEDEFTAITPTPVGADTIIWRRI
jgi:hypothetical protein